MNKIIISGLNASCILGIRPEERVSPQQVIVDLSLNMSLTSAAGSDDIKDTVDYDELSAKVLRFIRKSDFKLLEKLAYEVAKLAKEYTRASEVRVLIKKPAALTDADYAAVEFTL